MQPTTDPVTPTSAMFADNPVFVAGMGQLRAAFSAESVDPRVLWYLASEGLGAWVRYVERALGDHLDDRHRARAILTAVCGEMFVRRASALPGPLARDMDGASPEEVRALFEALYPGPVGRSVRWCLDAICPEAPGMAASLRGWRRVMAMDPRDRWLEVSHHLGELTIVLTERLGEHRVPRAMGWLGDVCHAFGKEVGELTASIFALPPSTESAIETLRMGELLFRVNPEHTSGSDSRAGTGFIEGNACLWYTRPGWGPSHCGVLGRFQAGVSEVFGLRYALTQTIPKHGGDSCRISLVPLLSRSGASASGPDPTEPGPPPWEPSTRRIDAAERAATLESLAAGRDPDEGFFGPDSLVWEGTRETVLLLGGGRAALMQLAHPAVAHAIRDHSAVHTDMLGRFRRTMLSAYDVLFGSVGEALDISRRVHRVHRSIAGRLDDVPGHPVGRYHALDPEAIFWVGATLVETTLLVYEQMVRPFTPAERDRLVREAAPFWVLFGAPLEACPTSWADLHGYVTRRADSLAPRVGDTARGQAAMLFRPNIPGVGPVFAQVRLVVAQMLPPPLRKAFGMDLDPRERMVARAWIFAAERLTPRLPPRLRYVPAYHRALRRTGR